MIKLKILIVLFIVSVTTIQNTAIAQAPTKTNIEALALHEPKLYAQILVTQKGWTAKQYACLNDIWTNESHWNYKAKSPISTAFGIWQGITETSHEPDVQIRNGIRYISYRYGNPCTAWKWWQRHYWY